MMHRNIKVVKWGKRGQSQMENNDAKGTDLYAAKSDKFFRFNSILGPILGFKQVRLALKIQKTGPIGSG